MKYRCRMCGEIYDEEKEGVKFADLPDTWTCPVCGAPKELWDPVEEEKPASNEAQEESSKEALASQPAQDSVVEYIQKLATSGQTQIEAGGAKQNLSPWQDVLIMAGQLASKPLADSEEVETSVVLGPKAKQPLKLKQPILVSHMSYGALSGEVKLANATGAKACGVAVESGEGGLYEPEFEAAENFIFEYVPNKYSANDENLQKVSAIEIKIGQAAKPGLGGHLPGTKVTPEISAMRGFPVGEDIISPPAFPEVNSKEDLKKMVDDLRKRSKGRPIGIKIAANNIEDDLAIIKFANPDFITIDGRGGGTGAAPAIWKENAGVPTLYALIRARKFMDEHKMPQQLIITGGLRSSADIFKCLALGADVVAMATAVLTAITAQNDLEKSQRVANFLGATIEDLKGHIRACGLKSTKELSLKQLATTSHELALHSPIRHVGF